MSSTVEGDTTCTSSAVADTNKTEQTANSAVEKTDMANLTDSTTSKLTQNTTATGRDYCANLCVIFFSAVF